MFRGCPHGLFSILRIGLNDYNPPAPLGAGGLKVNIQIFSYRLAKPSKPVFFPKVAKSEAT